jgi:hypothetical protein
MSSGSHNQFDKRERGVSGLRIRRRLSLRACDNYYHYYHIVIVSIVIIRLALIDLFSTSSNSLFKGVPSRLRPYGL